MNYSVYWPVGSQVFETDPGEIMPKECKVDKLAGPPCGACGCLRTWWNVRNAGDSKWHLLVHNHGDCILCLGQLAREQQKQIDALMDWAAEGGWKV